MTTTTPRGSGGPGARATPETLTVSQLVGRAKRALEQALPMVRVEGEVGDLTRARSGHWYFTLKDDGAEIRVVMFRSRNARVRFDLKPGDHVVARVNVTIYEQRGSFQAICEHLALAGEGALLARLEALRAQLAAEGLFDPDRKRPLPATPAHVALVTSASGAALHDMLRMFAARAPQLELTLLPVSVQGPEAPPTITRALALIDAWNADPARTRFDVAIVGRGGGSAEDLLAFNDERVVRAIAASTVPVVSAVGHEIDVSLADHAADVRAPTPTAAAEMVCEHLRDLDDRLDAFREYFEVEISHRLADAGDQLKAQRARLRHPGERLRTLMQRADIAEQQLVRAIRSGLEQRSLRVAGREQALRGQTPSHRIRAGLQQVEHAAGRLRQGWRRLAAAARARLETAAGTLDAVSPLATLARGYSIVRDGDDQIVRSGTALSAGDSVTIRFAEGGAAATIVSTETEPDGARETPD